MLACRTLLLILVFFLIALPLAGADDVVQFNRDIRPLLSDNCFTCHGPDSKNRLTKLRFDTEAGAQAGPGRGTICDRAWGSRQRAK